MMVSEEFAPAGKENDGFMAASLRETKPFEGLEKFVARVGPSRLSTSSTQSAKNKYN